jgi:hypothetical protein
MQNLTCPSGHKMVEIAPELFQCPECGSGPSRRGFHPFVALYQPQEVGGYIEALAVSYSQADNAYTASDVTWGVEDEQPIPGTLECAEVGVFSTEAELQEAPLPVVIRSHRGEWPTHPGRLLRALMCESPFGEKTLEVKAERGGKSSKGPSRSP